MLAYLPISPRGPYCWFLPEGSLPVRTRLMEKHIFRLIRRLEILHYLSRCSVYFENFPGGQTKSQSYHLHPNRNFRNFLVNGKKTHLWNFLVWQQKNTSGFLALQIISTVVDHQGAWDKVSHPCGTNVAGKCQCAPCKIYNLAVTFDSPKE